LRQSKSSSSNQFQLGWFFYALRIKNINTNKPAKQAGFFMVYGEKLNKVKIFIRYTIIRLNFLNGARLNSRCAISRIFGGLDSLNQYKFKLLL
jgi:hypothetical protein